LFRFDDYGERHSVVADHVVVFVALGAIERPLPTLTVVLTARIVHVIVQFCLSSPRHEFVCTLAVLLIVLEVLEGSLVVFEVEVLIGIELRSWGSGS
jgi:hypothetical protein